MSLIEKTRTAATERSHTVPSRVAIRQHPLHPMIVVYPVAFLSSVFFTDLAFVVFGYDFWAQVSLFLNLAGLATGLLAAIVGMADFLLVHEVRRHVSAWSHLIAAVMVLAIAAASAMLRWPDPVAGAWPWGMLLSAVLFVLVMVAGWLGGTLSFKYGIGVYGRDETEAHGDDDSPPAG